MSENNLEQQATAPAPVPATAPAAAPAPAPVPAAAPAPAYYEGYAPTQAAPGQNEHPVNYNNPAAPSVQPQDGPLSGGKKFAWFAIGFLSGVPGVLIAWLMYQDFPLRKKDGFKFSLIGAVAFIVIAIIYTFIIMAYVAVILTATVDSLGSLDGNSYGLYKDYFGGSLY